MGNEVWGVYSVDAYSVGCVQCVGVYSVECIQCGVRTVCQGCVQFGKICSIIRCMVLYDGVEG